MAEDLQENLSTYKVQLQQVDASLMNDPDNDDLNKLKKDLEEVIELTEDLLSAKVAAEAVAVGDNNEGVSTTTDWRVGDTCLAPYSADGQHYEAKIEELLPDGTCTVTFETYGNTDVTQVTLLKRIEEKQPQGGAGDEASAPKKPQTKKDLQVAQREYKRKKQQKKKERLKLLEEEREQDKMKWLDFNSKTFSKTTKGHVKKSIFATTDQVQGRVGVGTCGKSGRPMTGYTPLEKWKK